MDDIYWDDWLSRKEITIDDALWLSMPSPIKPPGTGFPETSLFDGEYKERREIVESWQKKGMLPGGIKREEIDRDWYIKPLVFFRLAREAEWLNPLNSEHDPIFIYLETIDKAEREISENAHIQHLTDIVKESPKSLDSGWIAELWAAMPGESYENKPFWQIRDDYKNQIESAVIEGELEAVVEIREPGFDDGYKELTEKNRIRKIKDGWLNGADVRLTIYREQFQEWLKKSNQWPLVDSCLLVNWFSVESKADAVEDDEKDTRASQLHALIWRIRQHVYNAGKGSAQKVWNEIQHRHKQHDTDEIIQEVTATEILWCSAYGNEPKFQRSSLDSLLSRLKKSPPFE